MVRGVCMVGTVTINDCAATECARTLYTGKIMTALDIGMGKIGATDANSIAGYPES